MKIYDQHLHSNFSFDSEENIENYFISNENNIVTTEHMDVANPVTGKNDFPDYPSYDKKIRELNEKYNNRAYKGIEIGFFPEKEEETLKYLDGKTYALKLLSVHHNGKFDFMDDIVTTLPVDQVLDDYFNRMIQALESHVSANVLAHFDYALRKLDVTAEQLDSYAKKYLDKIIHLTIGKEMSLELNAKSMYIYGNEKLYSYMVEKYIGLGGRLFTLGSDAHSLDQYGNKFDQMREFLLKYKISEVAEYTNDLKMRPLR